MMKKIVFMLLTLFAVSSFANSTNPIVVLQTNKGLIEIELYPTVAPKACENFIGLIKKGYYDKTIFHRVIKRFMIQGGDPTGTGRGGESLWGQDFADEYAPNVTFNQLGLLAMANRGPSTNGSQFFITTAITPWLNGRHTIFGKVISGYDVVKSIEAVETGYADRPKETQAIQKAYVK
jgi:peptidylprolyl isomerase